ncbi:hypothetical protein ISCGN_015565 [Ixodes scapularis]
MYELRGRPINAHGQCGDKREHPNSQRGGVIGAAKSPFEAPRPRTADSRFIDEAVAAARPSGPVPGKGKTAPKGDTESYETALSKLVGGDQQLHSKLQCQQPAPPRYGGDGKKYGTLLQGPALSWARSSLSWRADGGKRAPDRDVLSLIGRAETWTKRPNLTRNGLRRRQNPAELEESFMCHLRAKRPSEASLFVHTVPVLVSGARQRVGRISPRTPGVTHEPVAAQTGDGALRLAYLGQPSEGKSQGCSSHSTAAKSKLDSAQQGLCIVATLVRAVDENNRRALQELRASLCLRGTFQDGDNIAGCGRVCREPGSRRLEELRDMAATPPRTKGPPSPSPTTPRRQVSRGVGRRFARRRKGACANGAVADRFSSEHNVPTAEGAVTRVFRHAVRTTDCPNNK